MRYRLSLETLYRTALALSIGVVVFAVYLPALHDGFVNWDDYDYVLQNREIRSLDFRTLRWALTSFEVANWHPLTWISYSVDYHFWKLDPAGYHLQSILLHVLNVIILMPVVYTLVLRGKMAKSPSPLNQPPEQLKSFAFSVSALTAIFFGLHPIHVESVVWISERKDVLSAFFYLISIFFYIVYTQADVKKIRMLSYGASLLAFGLALTAKPMAVTLPALLLLLDCTCLKRPGTEKTPPGLKKVLFEKTPFLLLAVIDSILTIYAQHSEGAIKTFAQFPPAERILNSVRAYGFYVFKMLFPLNLSPFYPYPKGPSSPWLGITSLLFILSLCAYCFVAWKKGKRYWAGILGFYMVSLLPVIGIIQIGEQAAAVRYTYIPGLGFSLLAGLGFSRFFHRFSKDRQGHLFAGAAGICLVFLIAAGLSVISRVQISYWKDSRTLWSRAIELYPYAARPYAERGLALLDFGDIKAAYADCDHAIKTAPYDPMALMCRAEAAGDMGNHESALADYSSVIRIEPDNWEALNRRGMVYVNMREYAHAYADFISIVKKNANYVDAYYNLACLYSVQKEVEGACFWLERAINAGFSDFPFIENDKTLDNIRVSSCYQKIVKKIGLPSGSRMKTRE
jgi:hypothetical protein